MYAFTHAYANALMHVLCVQFVHVSIKVNMKIHTVCTCITHDSICHADVQQVYSIEPSIMRMFNITWCWAGALYHSHCKLSVTRIHESSVRHCSVYVSWGWWYDDTTTVFSCINLTSFKTFLAVVSNPLMSLQVRVAVRRHRVAVYSVVLSWHDRFFYCLFSLLHSLDNFKV